MSQRIRRPKFTSLFQILAGTALVIGIHSCGAPTKLIGTKFYPASDTMLFSAYTLRSPELLTAKANGFTAVGPYYGRDKPKTLRFAELGDLPLIYTVGPRVDFAAPDFDAAEALEQVAEEVRRMADLDRIAIWNLGNEELRHWRTNEMDWLKDVTKVIKANDPLGRPIMMYEPNHRDNASLLLTGKYLDYVTKGTYTNYVGMKNQRAWLRWSLEETLATAKATGALPIAVLWMARDQTSEKDIESIPAWVRHDVYSSLISGAKGIIVYSAFNRRKGFRQHFKNFFDAYAEAARELNGPLNLSQVFLFGTPHDDVEITQISGPQKQVIKYRDAEREYPSIQKFSSTLDGQHYLFLVNSANSAVSYSLSGIAASAEVFDVFTNNSTTLTDTMHLDALEVRGIRWE